jgi:hypothetical protein
VASASGNLLVCAVMSGAVCEVLGGWAQGWSDVLVLPTSTSPDVRLFADAAKPMPITVAMAQKAMAGTVCDVVGGEMLLIDVVPAGSGVLDSAASMLFVVADATGQVTYRAFRASNAQQLATLSRAAVVEDGGGAASAARVVALQSARAAIQPAQQVLSGDAAKLHAYAMRRLSEDLPKIMGEAAAGGLGFPIDRVVTNGFFDVGWAAAWVAPSPAPPLRAVPSPAGPHVSRRASRRSAVPQAERVDLAAQLEAVERDIQRLSPAAQAAAGGVASGTGGGAAGQRLPSPPYREYDAAEDARRASEGSVASTAMSEATEAQAKLLMELGVTSVVARAMVRIGFTRQVLPGVVAEEVVSGVRADMETRGKVIQRGETLGVERAVAVAKREEVEAASAAAALGNQELAYRPPGHPPTPPPLPQPGARVPRPPPGPPPLPPPPPQPPPAAQRSYVCALEGCDATCARDAGGAHYKYCRVQHAIEAGERRGRAAAAASPQAPSPSLAPSERPDFSERLPSESGGAGAQGGGGGGGYAPGRGAARARAVRAVIDEMANADSSGAPLFDGVAAEEIEEAFTLVAAAVGVETKGEWSPRMVVPTVIVRLSEALDRANLSASDVLARHKALSHPSSRMMAAVTSLVQRSAGAAADGGASSSRLSAGTATATAASKVRAACERLAADSEVLQRLQQMARTADKDGSDGELRAQAKQIEQLNPDVAFILHQENLDRITSSGAAAPPSPAAVRVWELCYSVRPRLHAARIRYFAEDTRGRLLPTSVNAGELIKAANCGKLTLAVVAGTASVNPETQMAAMLRVWPSFVALIEELYPRDKTVRFTLLAMAHEVFDLGSRTAARALQVVVGDVFAAMTAQFNASWLAGVGDMPTWEAVRETASTKSARLVAVTGSVGGVQAQASAAKLAREQAAQAAREAKAAAEARAAAAGEPPVQPGAPGLHDKPEPTLGGKGKK